VTRLNPASWTTTIRSGFWGDALLMAGGTIITQALGVLIAPILTRLYTPADFGYLSVFNAFLLMWVTISSLRYDFAIHAPKFSRDAAILVCLCLFVVVIMSFVSYFIAEVSIYFGVLGNVSGRGHFFAFLVAFGVLFCGAFQVFTQWNARTKHFGLIARAKIAQGLSMLALQVALHPLGWPVLVVGHMLGQGVGGLSLVKTFWTAGEWKGVTARDLFRSARTYWKYPILDSGAALLNVASLQLPPLLFAGMYGPKVAGLYFLGHRVMMVPVSVISASISGVTLSHASDAFREGRLKELVWNTFRVLAGIALPLFALMFLVVPPYTGIVFGGAWQEVGYYMRAMSPWIALVFIVSPLSVVPTVLQKQHIFLVFNGLIFIVRLVIILGLFSLAGFEGVILVFSLASALAWLLFLFWIMNACGHGWIMVGRLLANNFLVALGLALPFLAAWGLGWPEPIRGICALLTGVLVLARVVWVAKTQTLAREMT